MNLKFKQNINKNSFKFEFAILYHKWTEKETISQRHQRVLINHQLTWMQDNQRTRHLRIYHLRWIWMMESNQWDQIQEPISLHLKCQLAVLINPYKIYNSPLTKVLIQMGKFRIISLEFNSLMVMTNLVVNFKMVLEDLALILKDQLGEKMRKM